MASQELTCYEKGSTHPLCGEAEFSVAMACTITCWLRSNPARSLLGLLHCGDSDGAVNAVFLSGCSGNRVC